MQKKRTRKVDSQGMRKDQMQVVDKGYKRVCKVSCFSSSSSTVGFPFLVVEKCRKIHSVVKVEIPV